MTGSPGATASEARDELEAVMRRAATAIGRDMRPCSLLGEAAFDAILAAADRYREAAPDHDGRTVHLEGLAGAQTACRYQWTEPEPPALTGDPAAVTCGGCRRSRRYRDMTGDRTAGRLVRLTFPLYEPGAADILACGRHAGLCLDEGGRWRAYLFPVAQDSRIRTGKCEEVTARKLTELKALLRKQVAEKGPWWTA